MRPWRMAAAGLVAYWAVLASARAAAETSCARALELIHYHPAIEANSVLALVAGTWHGLDQQTVAAGHASIANRLLASQAAMNGLVRQCQENPGESIQSAARAVYFLARQQWEGL